MISSQGTVVQGWSRGVLVGVTFVLICLHVLCFFVGLIFAPSLFNHSEFRGSTCQNPKDSEPTWYEDRPSQGSCIPVSSGAQVPLQDVVTSFRFPDERRLSRWNWRLVASLIAEITFHGENIPSISDEVEAVDNVTSIVVRQQKPEVFLTARLDATSENETSRGWNRVASKDATERSLDCHVTVPVEHDNDTEASVKYMCVINPLLDMHIVDNTSYIVTVQFADRNGTEMVTNPANIDMYLTVIVESVAYHQVLFYMKCSFTPFILVALVWFCVRMYLNDLYISIPDRLLITCGLAQFIHNVPTEVLVDYWPIAYLKLLDDLSYLVLMTCLMLFWTVYTSDKLAKNEPWERNTRYYWRPFSCIIFLTLVAALYSMYDKGPTFQNPFNNHWHTATAEYISLSFLFGLAVFGMAFQTYLSVLIFRVLCDISVSVIPTVHRVWRIKLVLLYCFSASLLTVGGFILRLAIALSLNWNQQVYIDPVPFHLTFSSPVFLGLEGLWNVHIFGLLVMLSRGDGPFHDYVQPVRYSENGTNGHHGAMLDYEERQETIHLWDLNAQASPIPKEEYVDYESSDDRDFDYSTD